MTSADWLNVARCANIRADAKTFSWGEDDSPLGDLITREAARMLAYRQALLDAVVANFVAHGFP